MTTPHDNYTGLVISSGGVKGISCLGALTIFEMDGYLKDIKSYAGCSIGSIISLLLACGWKAFELYRRAVKIKLFNGMSDISIENFKTKHGLISNELLRQELETLVIEKRGKLPTLLDFYNEGIYLSFSICDRRTKTGRKLDWQSNPLLLATEGALMSSNMPVIFPPMEFEGMRVVDGALSNPFPVDYLDNNKDKILGISVYGDNADDGLFNTLSEYLMMPIEEIQRRITRQASDRVDILEMRVVDISVMDLQASFEAKDNMFFAGLENAKLMVRVLNKKRRREKRHQQSTKRSKPQAAIPPVNPINETNNKPALSGRRPPNNLVRVPLKAIPEEILVKCLLSQPLDILLLAAINHRDTLQASFKRLSAAKINHLKLLAKQILVNEEPVKYSRRRHSNPIKNENQPLQDDEIPTQVNNNNATENNEADYGGSYNVRVKENHSQKIYEHLPAKMKEIAKVVFSSLTPEQSKKTMSGINIIVEGLNRLGINIFNGLLLEGGSSTVENEGASVCSPREVVSGRVEIVADDDFGKNSDGTPKRASDNID